jgi:hypothetical protein
MRSYASRSLIRVIRKNALFCHLGGHLRRFYRAMGLGVLEVDSIWESQKYMLNNPYVLFAAADYTLNFRSIIWR